LVKFTTIKLVFSVGQFQNDLAWQLRKLEVEKIKKLMEGSYQRPWRTYKTVILKPDVSGDFVSQLRDSNRRKSVSQTERTDPNFSYGIHDNLKY
jgi:hypothetical protein